MKKKLEIDFVIETCLVAIYSENLLSKTLFLKGGQALRIKENIKNRFSADIDFSTPGKITDEEAYFELIESSLTRAFHRNGFYLFAFDHKRKPKFKSPGTPDFWSGWAIEFKLIEEEKRNDPKENISREALVPVGAKSPAITFDISEYEYCGAIEYIKIQSTNISVYSRALILCEKIRAICQQHPSYLLKGEGHRSRDYYDIERIWSKVIDDDNPDKFLSECARHLPSVFAAKGVDLKILDVIFSEDFLESQEQGWGAVTATVKGEIQTFTYYVDTLRIIITEIKKAI